MSVIKLTMEFGGLTNRQAMEHKFKQMRALSRQELLTQIYGKTNTKPQQQPSVQQDLTQAFSVLLHNYDFDRNNPIVSQISQLFSISLDSILAMDTKERLQYVNGKIQGKIEESIRIVDKMSQGIDQARGSTKSIHEPNSHFEWLGVNNKYTQLRPIFEQIILQKVKLFDRQLCQLTELPEQLPTHSFAPLTTDRSGFQSSHKEIPRSKTVSTNIRNKKVQNAIEGQFTNVKIRDKSQFSLNKWTRREEDQFMGKKAVFRSNLKINNIPVLFQFVKKYTSTVKARDNIYRKWQQRQKTGITPQQLKYLCATSLFLNKTMAKSQKQRVKSNVKAAGSHLISRLELNIAEKIIQTYRQLMKRVTDLRAKYYQELTQERKLQQHQSACLQQSKHKSSNKQNLFLKYKATFTRIVNSEKMKLKLKPNILRWVNHFITNIMAKIGKTRSSQSIPGAFRRLVTEANQSTLIYKHKVKYPSAKIIKREDMYSHRLKYRKYIPSERFFYDKKFQETIGKINKVKLSHNHSNSYIRQLSGGPKKQKEFITVDLSKKRIFMSSPLVVKYVVKIQAKWKAVYKRRRFLSVIEDVREANEKQFLQKLSSLYLIYRSGKKIDMRVVESRLKRISMKITNIIRPYQRVIRRPINVFTSFCLNKLTNVELKNKHARNGTIRLGQFGKLVENNFYIQLRKSGIVVTDKEINALTMKNGTSAIWWAVYHSNIELTTLFLQGGGDPNSKDMEGETCLHVAVRSGSVPIIFVLLDYGGDLNRKNNKKVTPLFHASKRMLKLLGLQEGGVIGDKDNNATFFRRSQFTDVYKEHFY